MTPSRKRHVLNILDVQNPHVGPCLTALLADVVASSATRGLDVHALIIGPTSAELAAHNLGLHTFDRIGAHCHSSWLALPALRRYLRRRPAVDLIHAWSLSTGTLAAMAAPGIPRIITLSVDPPSTSPAHWLRTLTTTASAPTAVLALSHAVKRSWIQHGARPEQFLVVHPGLDIRRIDRSARSELRRRWGIKSQNTLVLGLLGQPSGRCDARRAGRILSMMHLSDLDTAMIIAPDADRIAHGFSIVRSAQCTDRFVTDESISAPWQVLPGLDAALILGNDSDQARVSRHIGHAPIRIGQSWWHVFNRMLDPGASRRIEHSNLMPGILPMHWAAAAGKAIIAEASYAVLETAEPNQSALLATPGADDAIVERIRQLRDDRQLDWAIRDRARSEAYSLFSPSRFCSDIATIWNQIMRGQPASVSQIPMTGGLAFSQHD